MIIPENKKYFEKEPINLSACAVMDRLIHQSHIVNINGDSYRLKQKRKSGILPVKRSK